MRPNRLLALCLATLLSVNGLATASFINGGFETGTFAGWSTIGTTAVAFEPYTTGISGPFEGAFQAGMLTGAATQGQLETFFGLAAGDLDVQLARDAFGGSGILQTITVQTGDLLTFHWNFLNGEGQNTTPWNDTAFVVINNIASPIADTFTPLSPDNFSTGYQTFQYIFPFEGTYTIGVGVVNVADNFETSGLYVDNFNISTPAPPALLLGIAGLPVLAAIRRRK